jgi:inorganic pyrophosphatase
MRVFIENEAGTRRKNIYDERTLAHLRTVEVSAAYPFPDGFVLGTISGDGDAVDCFVLSDTPLRSGTIVECEPVGLLEQIEDGETDHKVLAVLPGAGARLDAATLAALRTFIAGVFAHVPGKRMQIGRLLDRPAAEAYVLKCRAEHSPPVSLHESPKGGAR